MANQQLDGGWGFDLASLGLLAQDRRAREAANQQYMGLLGTPEIQQQTQPFQPEMFPGEAPIPGLSTITQQGRPGTGLLGGQISPQQFYGTLMSMPGYEQVGAKGLSAAIGLPTSDLPSSIREWNIFSQMTPDQQKQYLDMKRAQQIVDVGGVKTVVSPVPGQNKPLSTLQQEAKGQAAIAGGKTAAMEESKRLADIKASFPKARTALQAQNRQWDFLGGQIDKAIESIGYGTTGAASYTSGIKGTPAYNLARLLDTIKANIGFDKLAEMRASSPTGGALGQVSEFENRLLQAVKGSLDQGQDPEILKANLASIKEDLKNLKQYTNESYQQDYSNFLPKQTEKKSSPQPPKQKRMEDMTDEELLAIINAGKK